MVVRGLRRWDSSLRPIGQQPARLTIFLRTNTRRPVKRPGQACAPRTVGKSAFGAGLRGGQARRLLRPGGPWKYAGASREPKRVSHNIDIKLRCV